MYINEIPLGLFLLKFWRASAAIKRRQGTTAGFTLIELSIVLVIIGFIVGGILIGQDLIRAAEVRAQIAQIEKYNIAVNTFRGKYGGLPGDLDLLDASNYGFYTANCNGSVGERDGNGLIDGPPINWALNESAGETGLFWVDLSQATLIDGTFPNQGVPIMNCAYWHGMSGTSISGYLPTAKIGRANFIYVYETSGVNWFGLSEVTAVSSVNGIMTSGASLPVVQTYNIDAKMDDGKPLSGNVMTSYINGSATIVQTAPSTSTSGGNSTSCYDTNSQTYSITVNGGAGTNCALSFRFQ